MGALRLPWLRCAAGRRGSALGAVWRTGLRPLLRTSCPFFGSRGVVALPGGAGCGVSLQATSTSTSTPKQKPFLRHGAEGLYLAPAPTPLHWLRPARNRPLLARSRARHLRPVRPPPGASLLNFLSCGPRQPAPGRRFPVPQASCGTARAAIKPGSLTQRLMAAAVAAVMMWHRQTGKSQRGGSVSAGKSAHRGVRVNVVLNRPKTLSEKAVASRG
ncbi:hypothetical protein [Pectobacterium cacticida]|uniref:hypothetical protein n=1 Tax=Pectobacterium cacticida TaxID=69221 RepID=UPI002FEF0DC6